jgi:hypothetical protein
VTTHRGRPGPGGTQPHSPDGETTAASSRRTAVRRGRPVRAPLGQAGGLIRLSGRTPKGAPNQSSCRRGSDLRPADPGKAGCPFLSSPGRRGWSPRTERHAPHRQTPAPAPGPPCPAAVHDPLPGRPHQGRPPGAGYAGRAPARSLTRLPARRTRQLSGAGSRFRHAQNQGNSRRKPRLNHLHCRPIQVRRVGARSRGVPPSLNISRASFWDCERRLRRGPGCDIPRDPVHNVPAAAACARQPGLSRNSPCGLAGEPVPLPGTRAFW